MVVAAALRPVAASGRAQASGAPLSPTGHVDWKARFLANALSGFGGMALSMTLGLVMFRMLFTSWEPEEFGFWTLLWSIVGFGYVADFGLGLAVQRSVARMARGGDATQASRVLSTAFWFFVAVGPVLSLLALIVRAPLFRLVDVSGPFEREFTHAYVLFVLSFAISLAFGIFPEVLAGAQRLDVANVTRSVVGVANFTAIALALHHEARFSTIVLIACLGMVAPGIAASLLAFRLVPGLSLNPWKHFRPGEIREHVGFSLTAYVISLSSKLLAQSDRLVIASMLGLPAVAMFQVMDRIGFVLRVCADQLSALASPAAAHLHARADAGADAGALGELVCRLSRLSFVLVTPLYVLAAVHLPSVARVLTRQEDLTRADWILGQVVLLAAYSATVGGSAKVSLLVMTGEERWVLRRLVGLLVANVALSVVLAVPLGSIGVALATLVCGSVYMWGAIVAHTLRKIGMTFGAFVRFHLRGCVAGFAAGGAVLLALQALAPIEGTVPLSGLLWRGALVLAPAVALNHRTLRATWAPGTASEA